MTEPDPALGNVETNYTYNLRDQLTGVSMPRGATTQTRTFNYDLTTGRLSSATNPENGTVSYTYNADGTLPPGPTPRTSATNTPTTPIGASPRSGAIACSIARHCQ